MTQRYLPRTYRVVTTVDHKGRRLIKSLRVIIVENARILDFSFYIFIGKYRLKIRNFSYFRLFVTESRILQKMSFVYYPFIEPRDGLIKRKEKGTCKGIKEPRYLFFLPWRG